MAENLILLIDPLKNLIHTYRMILEEENYVVEASRNIKEAFHHLSKCNYFIIITEYFAPHEEIHRLIHWVKKNGLLKRMDLRRILSYSLGPTSIILLMRNY